jgi:hypothetical protein
MKILLDAKDLIGVVEHSRPVSVAELRSWLLVRNSVLVYSLENVRALAGPLASDPSCAERVAGYLMQLETLPHCYISANIDRLEQGAAVGSFVENREYQPIDPYVPRFDCVFPPLARPDRPSYTISEVIFDAFRRSPQIFARRPNIEEFHANAMGERRNRVNLKAPVDVSLSGTPFVEFLIKDFHVSDGLAKEVFSWVAAEPYRCPGLHLIAAMGAVVSRDIGYVARPGDPYDLSDVMQIPYVDRTTLDRTMHHYFRTAVRQLERSGELGYVSEGVFKSLSELLKAEQ